MPLRDHAPLILTSVLVSGLLAAGCLNPFAPGLEETQAESACDPTTIDGVFQCFQAAYTFRDTTLYGQLIGGEFVFIYRDYDLGIDVTWGRNDEMRTTYGLFRNAQKLDLIWNNIVNTSAESTRVTVVRGFNLTVVFNPSNVERVDGYANFVFSRFNTADPWKIVSWRDESNF
jgi:hypothetical protein